MTFHLVIRGRKCLKYIRKCLNSVLRQTYKNWTATIILDPSEELAQILNILSTEYHIYPNMHWYVNNGIRGVCHNIYLGGKYAVEHAEDEDVVGYLDSDDRLKKYALEIVKTAYDKHGCLATVGSFISSKTKQLHRWNHFYPKGADHHKYRFCGSHFKTVKVKVLKTIPRESFMHKDGYGQAASDVAWTMAVLDRIGLKNMRHIKKGIYVYREGIKDNVKRNLQKKWRDRFKRAKPLKRLF